MPGELDEFRERQDGFDARLTTVEETVQAESRLRAAMDRDISDIKVEQRAQRGLLQALADTQSEHTAMLSAVEARLGVVEGRLGVVDDRLGVVEGKLGTVHVGVLAILARLDAMEEARLGRRIGRLLRARGQQAA
jgi:hypothetical protein